MRESRSPPPFNEEPQISKDFWGFFVFSSRGSFSSQLGLFSTPGVLLHRIFSSSDFTDESDGNLAYRITHGFPRIFGRWPMARARNGLLLFLSRRFRRWRRFFSLIILVPQISQIHTDFFSLIILSHRFHRFTQIFSHDYFSPTDFTDSRRVFWFFLLFNFY